MRRTADRAAKDRLAKSMVMLQANTAGNSKQARFSSDYTSFEKPNAANPNKRECDY